MKKVTVLALLFLFLVPGTLFSLPRFALRTGSLCADCHVNPTGGEMRNDRGWNMSRKGLTMMSPRDTIEISNRLAPNIGIGLDFRGQLLGKFLENSKRLDFQRMSASMYGNIDLSESINIYGRYDFIQQIWEGFAVARVLPGDGYLKGGVFIPNFGLRIDDHTAYTRGGDLGVITNNTMGLIYDPTYTETGVEAGVMLFDLLSVTGSVGRPNSLFRPVVSSIMRTDPTYTARASILPELSEDVHLLLGGSVVNFKRINQTFTGFDNVWMYGGFLGFNLGGFTLLGEFDVAKSYSVRDSLTTALMVEASMKITQGLDAVVRYDRFDPVTNTDKNELSRLVLGFEIFPYSFMEVRPQYRIQMEEPSIQNNSLVVQMHLYY